MYSHHSSVNSARQRLAINHLVVVVFADHVRAAGYDTGLPNESEIVPPNIRHGHRVDQRRHVHFVVDVDDMRYVYTYCTVV